MLGFLEFLKRFKVSEMRERELHSCFYTGSLNHKTTSSLLGQPKLGFHYIQNFYKSHTKITLLNKETHKIFDSQKSRHTLQESQLQTWNHIRQTNQRHKNIQTWWWLSLANHTCVLQATHKPKRLQDQPRSSKHEL